MSRKPSIIVGTDLSKECEHAVTRASAIARRNDAALHLVHASSRLPPALARRFLAKKPQSDRELEAVLETRAEALRSEGISTRVHVVPGGAAMVLRTLARELRAALVVVGSRGRNVADALLGSTAERVIAETGAAVLLARDPDAKAHRKIIIGVDVQSDVVRELSSARFVAGDAPLSLVHVYQAPYESKLVLAGADHRAVKSYRDGVRREIEEALAPRLGKASLEPRAMTFVHGSARLVLAEAAQPRSLLVLDRSASKIRHLVLGSVTRWVIEHSRGDVLLV